MEFQKGNEFWKKRSKHGRDALFTDPEKLLDAFYEYLEYTSSRKWYKNEAIKSGENAGQIIPIPIETPFTITGLCIFLGVNSVYLSQFKDKEAYKNNADFAKVIEHIYETIETQQIEGAIVGAFNANIVARKLGLSDKTETEHSGTITTRELKITSSKNADNG